MKQRFLLHLGFWLAYTLIYALLSTGFAAPSDLEYTWPVRFLRFWVGELIMLPLKLVATYGFLYFIIPQFMLRGRYLASIPWLVTGIAALLPAHRFAVYYLVYPWLYQEYPAFELFSASRLLFSFLDIMPAVTIAATIKLLRSRLASQRREQALVQEKLQSELNFLRAQTNPHFLFNTLNNIYALARKQSPQTPQVVMKLAQMLRFMLYDCIHPRIPIAGEVKLIQDYLELERLRYNQRLEIHFQKAIDDETQLIAPLLLLPFVENAFKHGASETRFDTFVRVNLNVRGGRLRFCIENSKEEQNGIPSEGIGLKNVRRQLELIYPDRHELEIKNQTEKYAVTLQIDLAD